MEFGIQFFPVVRPDERSAAEYWNDALELTGLCDELSYTSVRTVEHYFKPYGGYSPSPLIFLAAASQRTRQARLISGAILPVFNHPLKMAGEIGMLDGITNGRLEVGFARAFLPHEFAAFDRPLDESRDRFDEGLEQVTRLLTEENVSAEGRFHSFRGITSLPRPVQKPHPPFWVAAIQSRESFVNTGRLGHSLMLHPAAAEQVRAGVKAFNEARREAGHPGPGRVMVAFQMFCAPSRDEAYDRAYEAEKAYRGRLVEAASDWLQGTTSGQYQNYEKLIKILQDQTFEGQIEANTLWVGTPDDISQMVEKYHRELGGFDIGSMQVNFHTIPLDKAMASMRLFAREVLPNFQGKPAGNA